MAKKDTVAPQIAGFDYQFCYFVYLLLKLEEGESIGFEVLDDIHISTTENGIKYYQAKHSILKYKGTNTIKKLSTLDNDLWKTINNWISKIDIPNIDNQEFILFTNKTNDSNIFIDAVKKIKSDNKIIEFRKTIEDKILKKTKSEVIESYITKLTALDDDVLTKFVTQMQIETDVDNLESKLLKLLNHKNYQSDSINSSLLGLLFTNIFFYKFNTAKKGEEFIISFEDFSSIGERIFSLSLDKKSLPSREYQIKDTDYQNYIFIKQLQDIKIYNIEKREKQMELIYKFLYSKNNIDYWVQNHSLCYTDIQLLEKETIKKWKNNFDNEYGKYSLSIDKNDQNKLLVAHAVHSNMVSENLNIPQYEDLDIDTSHGFVYKLNDELKIGWIEDWEIKYKS